MSPRSRGFVLPTTLLVMALLTVMLTAAFVLVSAEFRTSDNSLASQRAQALAQAGLQTYFANPVRVTPSMTVDNDSIPLTGGYALVQANRISPETPNTLSLWVVRSIGYSTDPLQPGLVQGSRAVAQLARLNPGLLPAHAAMVAANGVGMQGGGGGGGANTNPIDGKASQAAIGSCTPPPGPSGWNLGLLSSDYTGGNPEPGNGKVILATATAVIDSTRILWQALIDGDFVPDYIVSGPQDYPPAGNTDYQVGYVSGNATLPVGVRRGFLVVRGDVFMQHNSEWNGVIIAGGRFDQTGSGNPNSVNYSVRGLVITGLDRSLGVPVTPNSVRRGNNRHIDWSYCHVANATAALTALTPVRNAWIDTWSIY